MSLETFESILASFKRLTDPQTVECRDQKSILMWTHVGGAYHILVREMLFALALNQRGACARIMLCGGLHTGCVIRNHAGPGIADWKRICANCTRTSTALLKEAGLEFHLLRDFISDERTGQLRDMAMTTPLEDIPSVTFKGMPTGRQAVSSTSRYFRSLLKYIGQDELEPVFREYFYSGLVSAEASAKALETLRPETLMMTNGIYVDWGPPMLKALEFGIPTVRHCNCFLKGHVMLKRITPEDTRFVYSLDAGEWKDLVRKGLDATKKQELDQYFSQAHSGQSSRIFTAPSETGSRIRETYNLPDDRPLWAIFPSLIWDSHLEYESMLFDGVVEWMIETLEAAQNIKDVLWIVKLHPEHSTEKHKTRWGMREIIEDRFPSLPENIRMIGSDNAINTLGLVNELSGGVTIRSGAALELAILGKPTILAGEAHYSYRGFTLDCPDKATYFKHMENAAQMGPLSQEQVESAKIYSHHYFIDQAIPFPFIGEDDLTPTFSSYVQLRPGNLPDLDYICDYILASSTRPLTRRRATGPARAESQ